MKPDRRNTPEALEVESALRELSGRASFNELHQKTGRTRPFVSHGINALMGAGVIEVDSTTNSYSFIRNA